MSRTRRNRRAGAKKPKKSTSTMWLLAAAGAMVLVVAGIVAGGGTSTPVTPADRDPELVAAGEDLFQANCATCHGSDLEGTATGPPFLDAIYAPSHHSDEAFQRAVQFGVQPHHWNFGPMAPIDGLDRDDVTKIVAYVRSEQEAAGLAAALSLRRASDHAIGYVPAAALSVVLRR